MMMNLTLSVLTVKIILPFICDGAALSAAYTLLQGEICTVNYLILTQPVMR